MADYDAFAADQSINESLQPCTICSRTFLPDTLVKHERICAKNQNKRQRKVFHSGVQRATGSDVPIQNVLKPGPPAPTYNTASSSKGSAKSSWRAKHEDFVNTIRAARGVTKALASGGPLPPPPPPTINPDYVQCPSCMRRFNSSAAERHIPYCKEKSKRLPEKKQVSAEAQRRREANLSYKPGRPKLKGREESSVQNGYNTHMNRSGSADSVRKGANTSKYGINGTAALRTGKTNEDYQSALGMKSSSMQKTRKIPPSTTSRMTKFNSHDSLYQANNNGYDQDHYSPSPPSHGRPPSGSYQHRGRDYPSELSSPSHRGQARIGSGDYRGRSGSASKFCHDCGNKFCKSDSKFCCECGMKRMYV